MYTRMQNRLVRTLFAASTVLALSVPYASALACSTRACCRPDPTQDGAQHQREAPCHESRPADAQARVPHHGSDAVSAEVPPNACPMMDAIGTANVAPLLFDEALALVMPVHVERPLSSADAVPNRLPAQLTPPPRS